jgi:hypothetical protein
MWRFYRHHLAQQRSTLVTAAVALGLCTKLVLALARLAVLRRRPLYTSVRDDDVVRRRTFSIVTRLSGRRGV